MKKILAILLTNTILTVSIAQADLGHCPLNSKNPQCYEATPQLPKGDFCGSTSFCDKVTSIEKQSRSGYYLCNTESGEQFDCTAIVNNIGEAIEGKTVMIQTNYADTCHIPGACGSRTCQPFNKFGLLSSSCK